MGKSRNKQQHSRHNNSANNNSRSSSNKSLSTSVTDSSSRKNSSNGKLSTENSTNTIDAQSDENNEVTFIHWLLTHKLEVVFSIICGFIVGTGFGFGTGFYGKMTDEHLQMLYEKQFRALGLYRVAAFGIHSVKYMASLVLPFYQMEKNAVNIRNAKHTHIELSGKTIRDDASHPYLFAVLRESIIREEGAFIHPDLGLLIPAPSGAARGLGMVSDSYNKCQTRCVPGISIEKLNVSNEMLGQEDVDNGGEEIGEAEEESDIPPFWHAESEYTNTREKLREVLDAQEESDQQYTQEEVLLRIPLSIQMTRTLALLTLTPRIPPEILNRTPLQELDDAALLVLLLAHEKGLGRESIFQAYIATLPTNPSCGYSPLLRNEVLETISSMGVEMDMDVNGWPGELNKAADHAEMIADGLSKDYGQYIAPTKGVSTFATMQWALCQVASRATAGSEKHGGLRMVPMADMINHDVNAGGFEELTGSERLENGDVIDAFEDDSGTFIVRSIRHGRRKPLKKGQELLVNYNVPDYSPLDWFISLGFVPPEKTRKWVLVDGALPKSRSYSTRTNRNQQPDL